MSDVIAPDEEELRQELRDAMAADGLSQSRTATEVGLSFTRLSQWLNGKYTGNRMKVAEQVRRWLDQRRAAAELDSALPSAPDWFDTPSSLSVMNALGFAQMAPALVMIYGGAGVGKTTAIRRYQHQAPNVWVVTATPATARPGPILGRIATVLGMRRASAVHEMENMIHERVRDTRGLLVIDEAQHLCNRSLDCVRQIHDETEIGVALAGNERVYAQMSGGSREAVYAQLFSRVAKRVRLTKPKPDDVGALLDAWKVTDPQTRKFCLDIGRRPGALRGLTQTLRLARMISKQAGEKPGPLTLSSVRAAWTDLGGDA